jgi:hypothetical protein
MTGKRSRPDGVRRRAGRGLRYALVTGLIALTVGAATLSVTAAQATAAAAHAPANDVFAHASPVPVSGAVIGSTAGAGTQPGEPGVSKSARSVWFTWTPAKAGQAFIVIATAGSPVSVRAYTGTRLATLKRVDVSVPASSHALAAIDAFPGVTYSLQVQSPAGGGGHFDLSILQPAAGAPANGSLKTATPLTTLVAQSVLHGGAAATVEGSTAGAKVLARRLGRVVWYAWTAPPGAGGSLELTLSDIVPRGAVRMAVFSGSRLHPVGSADAGAAITVRAGARYAIRISGAAAYFTLGVRSRGAVLGDTSGPRITCARPRAGWYDHNLRVRCIAHDRAGLTGSARSHFKLITAVAKGTATAFAQTNTLKLCDRSGRCADAGPITDLKIDRAPPVISCSTPPTGVFDAPVTLACAAYDPPGGSGLRDHADRAFMAIATIPATAKGLRDASFRHAPVCDRAGNCTRMPALKTVRIERSPPSVHCDAAPHRWVSRNVTIHCTGEDSGSGLGAPGDARFTLSTSVVAGVSTARAYTDTRAVCNRAGACIKVGPYGPLRVAREIPTVTCRVPVGWHRGTHARITCDAKSHGPRLVSAKDASFVLRVAIKHGHQAIKRSGTRRVCDAAGNCATAGPLTVELDDSPPSIKCQGTPRGWFTRSVTDTCTVSDAGSGVPPRRQLIKLTASLRAGRVSASVTIPRARVCDNVGNCTLTPRLKPARIDRLNPKVTCASLGSGTYTQNVTISCEANDARGPGLADTADKWFTLSTNVAAGRSNGHASTGKHVVCDKAGNCTQVGPLGPVRVDLAGSDGGVSAVPESETVLAAQPHPSQSAGVVAPYVEPGSIPGSGPSGACNPAPGSPLSLGETTVVCGIPTAHGLKTRSIAINVALAASNLQPHGPARAGQGWRAVGRGFGGHTTVIITLDGVAIATARAAKNGTVTAWFVMPPGLAAGPHHLAVTGRDGQGRPLIVATPLTVSTARTAGSGGAPLPVGPVTPITPLTLTDSGRLVAPHGTRSFHTSPPPAHRRRHSR